MKQKLQLRILYYFVIIYLVMAFVWWAVLLFRKNQDVCQTKEQVLLMSMMAEGKVKNAAELAETSVYIALKKKHQRQEYMIIGEAVVFVISLAIGIWLINRGYRKEIAVAQKERNFLLSITHELKSPIASIQLVLETLLKRQLNETQSRKLKTRALKETKRLHNLINDLLLSARLDSSYHLHLEKIDINKLLGSILSKLKEKYPSTTLLFQKEEVPFINGDLLSLSSVVNNLIENAEKYSHGEAAITISSGKVKNFAFFQIADKGIGISDKEKNRIFEKFYRIGNEDTRRTKGTGLGLFIVDQIVKAHKGKIQVFDNKPRGTVFKVLLPLSKPGNKKIT